MTALRCPPAVLLVVALSAGLCAAGQTIGVPSEGVATIAAALAKCQAGDTVVVADGVWREDVLMPAGVVLRAARLQGAAIRGRGRGPAVTMGRGSTLQGFVVERSGVGVLASVRDCRIAQCRISDNEQSGIVCAGNVPSIEDNIIAFNGASGVQGRDARSTSGTIAHNTIAYNRGHGLAFSGACDAIVECCIIASNEKADVMADDLAGTVALRASCIFRNGRNTTPLPEGNISVDPLFAAGRKMDFRLAQGSGCLRAAPDGSDLGARVLPQK